MSLPLPFLLLPVIIFLALIPPILLIAWITQHNAARFQQELGPSARARGAQIAPRRRRVDYRLGAIPVRLSSRPWVKAIPGWTRLDYALPGLPELSLKTIDARQAAGLPRPSGRLVAFGDRDFDGVFLAKARDPEAARVFLGPELRRRLLDLRQSRRGTGVPELSLIIRSNGLTLAWNHNLLERPGIIDKVLGQADAFVEALRSQEPRRSKSS